MNIILGEEQALHLREKYTVLELDTFSVQGSAPIKSYAVIENIPIPEMFALDKQVELHNKMIEQYHLRNWKFCQDALEHLVGKWNGEVNTFYFDIKKRIEDLELQELDSDWSGIVTKA
jgi:hypothetical protein